jgi:hypothetical protein
MMTCAAPELEIDHLIDVATLRAHEYGVPSDDWKSLLRYLAPLRDHSAETFAHSMRVGLYAGGLATAEGHNASFALGGGCAHDIGKLTVSNNVLHAAPFTDTEFVAIQSHPEAGFALLNDEHPLLALVAGLHHQFQSRAYGIGLDHPALNTLPDLARSHVIECVGIVATCDCCDAAMTRADGNHPHSEAEVRHDMLARGVPMSRIDWIFAHRLSADAS